MKQRGLDINGDWMYGLGFSNFATQSEGIKLNIYTKLREWKRDCFAALNNGIDWASRIGDEAQEPLLKSDIISLVQSLEGVQEVLNYTSVFNPSTRNITINFTYRDIYGLQTEISFMP
jgi:hypothetical protein